MITRIILAFIIFAGIAYYYNIDVRSVVDKSGVPTWLATHGITPTQSTAAAGSDVSSTAP